MKKREVFVMEETFNRTASDTANGGQAESAGTAWEELKEWNPVPTMAGQEWNEPSTEEQPTLTEEDFAEAEEEAATEEPAEEATHDQEAPGQDAPEELPPEADTQADGEIPAEEPQEETEAASLEEAMEDDGEYPEFSNPADSLLMDEPVPEPAVEKPRRKKKKRPMWVRRLRAFWRHLTELPAKTLLILGGSVALVLVIIILLVVLLPKGSSKTSATETATVTGSDVVTSVDPADTNEETDDVETGEQEETTPAINPILALNLPDGRTFLKLNDEADCVKDIQQRLIDLGYMETPVDSNGVAAVTSVYGPATVKAVKKFQWCNGLDVDGMLGAEAYETLMGDSARAIELKNSVSDSLFSDDILKLQNRLIELGYLAADSASGKFTDKTTAALKAFQENNGLTADGIAGLKTIEVLYGDSAK